MERKLILSGFMSALLLASVISYSLPAFAQGPDSPGKSQVVYAFGEIPGKNIIIHVAVIVPPGFDKNEVINQALNYQGAKKIEKSEYSLINSLKWDPTKSGSPNVTIFYDGDNEPLYLGGVGSGILADVMGNWTDVDNSNFVFTHGGDSTKECPSLVKECEGVADGENTFGWEEIKQPRTLGVTYWKTTEAGLEVDIVLTTNKKTSWNTNGANYDVFTVVLHELGHALGLGHSTISAAVMYASYHGDMDNLHQDDICGVQDLFGIQEAACSATTTPVEGDTVTASITYKNQKNGLRIQVQLSDGENPVNAVVEISLDRDGEPEGTGSASTGDDGSVTFVKRGAKSGCYAATIISVSDDRFSEPVEYPSGNPICI